MMAEAIEQAVKVEIEAAVKTATENAKVELERRVPEIVAGLVIRVMDSVRMEMHQHELVIYVSRENGGGMKTLEEHNSERCEARKEQDAILRPHPNGIECPKCGMELWDSDPAVVISTPKVHCPSCGYTGYRLI